MQGLTGAVLAGGRSERLGGRTKALLALGPGGETWIARTIALLEPMAHPILVGASDRERFAFLRRDVVADPEPGLGPIGGLIGVLEASPHDLCLVVACDMPFLSLPLLEHLVRVARRSPEAPAVVPRTAGGLHPLHAVYSRRLLPTLRARAASRDLALHRLLAAAGALEVDEAELRRYDPTLRSLENVNTEQDLERAFGAEAARAALRALEPR